MIIGLSLGADRPLLLRRDSTSNHDWITDDTAGECVLTAAAVMLGRITDKRKAGQFRPSGF